MQEVLDWLEETYPDLHETAEIDRAWVWLVADLRGDENKPTRLALKENGFIFHCHGGHLLESGAIGTWGNACEHPVKFKFHGKKQKGERATSQTAGDAEPERIDPFSPTETETSDADKEALAFAGL